MVSCTTSVQPDYSEEKSPWIAKVFVPSLTTECMTKAAQKAAFRYKGPWWLDLGATFIYKDQNNKIHTITLSEERPSSPSQASAEKIKDIVNSELYNPISIYFILQPRYHKINAL